MKDFYAIRTHNEGCAPIYDNLDGMLPVELVRLYWVVNIQAKEQMANKCSALDRIIQN